MSENYGIEETTCIRTGRRGTDTKWAGPTLTWIKIQKGYLGSEESQPYTRPPSPGFLPGSARKISPHNFWL